MVFTTEEHGFRLQSLLNKIDELEYSILIVKTSHGEVIDSEEEKKFISGNRSLEDFVRDYGRNVIKELFLVLVNHFFLHFNQHRRNIRGLDNYPMEILDKIK